MAGLSLVEMLVALAVGLSLATAVVEVYVGSTMTQRSVDSRSRIQESGRFAFHYLAQEIRMAGYLGCIGGIEIENVNSTLDAPPASLQLLTGIQGWEAEDTAPGNVNNSAAHVPVVATDSDEWSTSGGNVVPAINASPNSDIIRVWAAEGSPGLVSDITPGGGNPTFTAEDSIGIQLNDFVLLSDCERADILQVCDVGAGGATSTLYRLAGGCVPGNVDDATILSRIDTLNGEFAEAVRLQGVMFYVGKRGDVATNPPALFRRQLSATGTVGEAEELVEGVESMQILYGENLDTDARNTVDSYVPANQVNDWADVTSVRISLLMQSIEDGIVPSPQAYEFDGVSYSGDAEEGGGAAGDLPNDNRVRRVFVNTISLRNRALGY